MKEDMIKALFILVCFVPSGTSTTDPCVSPRVYDNLAKRSPNYTRPADETPIADIFIEEGWYGQQNYIIPTVPPGQDKCGTIYPVYMKGGQTIHGTIGTKIFCLQTRQRECDQEIALRVKKCDNFNVYNLQSLDVDKAAYCVEQISDNYPEYVTSVNIETDLNPDLEFICKFAPSTSAEHDGIWYTVKWYINGRLIKTASAVQDTTKIQTDSVLEKQEIIDSGTTKMGFQLKCGYAVSKEIESVLSPITFSPDEFIGIQILTPNIIVKAREVKDIILRSTVPIYCPNGPGCDIKLFVDKFDSSAACEPHPKISRSCGSKILANEWDKNVTLQIQGQAKNINGNTFRTTILNLRTVRYPNQQLWSNYSLGQVNVKVIKETKLIEGKKCHGVADPHMKTYIGTTYELYNGLFTMYENKDWRQEVQINTKTSCYGNGGYPYCICGVAIRVGKEVWRMDHCDQRYWKIGYTQCDDSVIVSLINVDVYSNKYKVTLPSNTMIEIDLIWTIFLNVHIFPADADRESGTSGLCSKVNVDGFIDRNGNTVSRSDFENSWRVGPANINLFSDEIQRLTHVGTKIFICECDQQSSVRFKKIVCKDDASCQRPELFPFKLISACEVTSRRRRRREAVEVNQGRQHHFIHRRQAEPTWRSGWTEVKARDYCNSLFQNSSTLQLCKKLGNVDFDGPLENCILDIKTSVVFYIELFRYQQKARQIWK